MKGQEIQGFESRGREHSFVEKRMFPWPYRFSCAFSSDNSNRRDYLFICGVEDTNSWRRRLRSLALFSVMSKQKRKCHLAAWTILTAFPTTRYHQAHSLKRPQPLLLMTMSMQIRVAASRQISCQGSCKGYYGLMDVKRLWLSIAVFSA